MAKTTLHIGAAGELLVQFRLARNGIDSARLPTDSGVDLVAYPPGTGRALTVQVKTVERSTPAGGKGALTTGVVFPKECPAEYVASVRLSDEIVWLFPILDALRLSNRPYLASIGTWIPTLLPRVRSPNRMSSRSAWNEC